MRIEVTDEDIVKGERCSPDLCPVALATSRALGKFVSIPSGHSAWIEKRLVKLPVEVHEFVRKFDAGRVPVKAFSFDLDLESEA